MDARNGFGDSTFADMPDPDVFLGASYKSGGWKYGYAKWSKPETMSISGYSEATGYEWTPNSANGVYDEKEESFEIRVKEIELDNASVNPTSDPALFCGVTGIIVDADNPLQGLSIQTEVTATPEPGTSILALAACVACAGYVWRRRRQCNE